MRYYCQQAVSADNDINTFSPYHVLVLESFDFRMRTYVDKEGAPACLLPVRKTLLFYLYTCSLAYVQRIG